MTLRAIDGNGFVPDEDSRDSHEILASVRESLGRIFDELAAIGRQLEALEAGPE
jgi:hypothetical protein